MDDYNKLQHIGPVEYKDFHFKLEDRFMITPADYERFVKVFHSRGFLTMMDWLRVDNEADIIPFIEAVNETHQQYYPDEIDMLNNALSIPEISLTYVLYKALKMKEPGDPILYAPGQPCDNQCNDNCLGVACKNCR